MERTISVIVPVYNVEAYLPECLDSILAQDYTDLEVILIDDGSTDSSGVICDEYAAKDPRIVVIHQKNGGAAAAKNAGLRVASGRYLSFVDSDDYLAPGAYRHTITQLEATGADVIQCSFCDVFADRTVPHPIAKGQKEFTAAQFLELFTKDWTCGLLWDKLYKRSMFDGIFFEEGHRIDDEYFTYRGIMNAKTIVRSDAIVYRYRMRKSSVMRSADSGQQILKDRIDYLSKRRANAISRYPELRQAFDRHFVEMMVILSRDPLATKEIAAIIRQQLHSYFREGGHTAIDIRLWPALLRIRFGLAKTMPTSDKPASQEHFFD